MRDEGSLVQIQTNRLDREWLSQPELMHEYCVKMADAKQKLNQAKATLEVVEAEMDRDVRMHPSRYGIDKLSEARIKNAVVLTESYRTASREVIEAQHEYEVIGAAVTALEHKKRALENMVHLWSMSYFSEPVASSEESLDKMREARRDRVLRPRAKKRGE